jgi:hypothetical protein
MSSRSACATQQDPCLKKERKRKDNLRFNTKSKQSSYQNKDYYLGKGSLDNNKEVLSPKRHKIKCVCTKQQSFNIHERKTDRTERLKQIWNYSWRLHAH